MSEIDALTRSNNKAAIETYQGGYVPKEMGITYNEELQMKTFEKAPLLRFLESKNRTSDTPTKYVGFFKEAATNDASFIDEGADIPDFAATTYTPVADYTRTLAEGIQISEAAQKGTNITDLKEREVTRAFLQVQNKTDLQLLKGTTADSKGFNSIWDKTSNPDINTLDSAGAVTEDKIDDMMIKLIDENGATPDVIVTDYFVAKQLREIVAPYRRWNDKQDIGIGFRVTTYEDVNGREIPILIDSNLPVSGSGSSATHNMLVLESDTIDIKYLNRPTYREGFATNGLVLKMAVYADVTAMNCADFKNGVITGITAPTTTTPSP